MVSARIQCGCKSLEMSASLTLGIRLSPKCYERVKIESLNLDSKVEQLKLEASKATNLPKHFLVLIYCGNVLDDNATLRSCGLKSGCTVQVLRKKEKDRPASVRILTEADIQELIQAFKTFNRHPSYRSALNRLIRKEVLENIIMATPGLKNDPAAMALLKDPDLILQMENSDTVKRIVEKHPSLADAASHIAAVIHEEIANNGNSANPGTSSGFTYALDSLSDEEDMDSSQSSDSQPTGDSLSRQQSFSTITTSQLAAALASASGQPQVETQGDAGFFSISPRASTSNLAGTSGSSSSLITSEMFDLAMQQAIANATPGASDIPSTSEMSSDVEAITRRLSRQLVQMRELGLTDTAANLQALHATGGDVQAAIDLVFSGAMSSDIP